MSMSGMRLHLIGAMAERLRRRSRELKVPSSIPRLGISFLGDFLMLIFIGLYMFDVVCAARLAICRIYLVS